MFLSLALFIFGSSVAQTASTPRVAPVNDSVAAQINRRIDEEMFYPKERPGRFSTGMVHVQFELDAAGSPTRIKLVKRSRSPALNKAARTTISRLGTISGAAPGQRFHAILQYDVAIGEAFAAKQKELAREIARTTRQQRLST